MDKEDSSIPETETNTEGHEVIDGKKIFFKLTTPDQNSIKSLIIYNHGFLGTSESDTAVEFSEFFNQNGHSVLRFDQPGNPLGKSGGDPLSLSFNEWVDCATYFAKKYQKLGYKISLAGNSMGASCAIAAGSELEKEAPDLNISLILRVPDPKTDSRSTPNRIYEEKGIKFSGKFWTEARDANLTQRLSEHRGPIHLTYGEADRIISEGKREEMIKATESSNGKVIIVPKGDHSVTGWKNRNSVYNAELTFLNSHTNPPTLST